MSYNVLDVVKDVILNQVEHVDRETYIERLELCKACEHLVMKFPITGGNCSRCGCFVRQKAKYKKSRCPLHPPKWGWKPSFNKV